MPTATRCRRGEDAPRMLRPRLRIAWPGCFWELCNAAVTTRSRWCLCRRSSWLLWIGLPEEQFRRLALRRIRDVCRRSASVTRQSICPIGESQSGPQRLRRSSRLSLICLPEEQFRRLAPRQTRDVGRRPAVAVAASVKGSGCRSKSSADRLGSGQGARALARIGRSSSATASQRHVARLLRPRPVPDRIATCRRGPTPAICRLPQHVQSCTRYPRRR